MRHIKAEMTCRHPNHEPTLEPHPKSGWPTKRVMDCYCGGKGHYVIRDKATRIVTLEGKRIPVCEKC